MMIPPHLDRGVPFGHFPHIEPNGWYHVVAELARLERESRGDKNVSVHR